MFSSPVVDIFMLTENHTRKDFMMLISARSWSVMQYVGVIPGFHPLITDRASAIISSPDGCLQQVMKVAMTCTALIRYVIRCFTAVPHLYLSDLGM